jgi:hypothetical protein
VDSFPQPGFPLSFLLLLKFRNQFSQEFHLPVEYFSMSGMNARSCACVIFSTGVGMPSITSGGSSCKDGSSGAI